MKKYEFSGKIELCIEGPYTVMEFNVVIMAETYIEAKQRLYCFVSDNACLRDVSVKSRETNGFICKGIRR